MVGEVTVCRYVSVASRCLQWCRIHAYNSVCVGRRLTEVHCVWFIVYVLEILILGKVCLSDVWDMTSVARTYRNPLNQHNCKHHHSALNTINSYVHTQTYNKSFKYYLSTNFIEIYCLSVSIILHFTYLTIYVFVINIHLFQNNKYQVSHKYSFSSWLLNWKSPKH